MTKHRCEQVDEWFKGYTEATNETLQKFANVMADLMRENDQFRAILQRLRKASSAVLAKKARDDQWFELIQACFAAEEALKGGE